MKLYTKIVSTILGLTVAASCVTNYAMAYGNSDVTLMNNSSFINALSDHLEVYYSNSENIGQENGSFYVGSEIPSYVEDENGNLELFTKTSFYPVYHGNETIGVFYVFHGEENDTYSYSEALGDELNSCSDNSDIAILLSENGESVVSVHSENYALTSSQRNNSLTPVSVDFSLPTASVAASSSPYFLSVPKWNQHVNGTYYALCWAGSMWSIGEYVAGSTYDSPFDIADELGAGYKSGYYTSDLVDPFYDLYGIDVVYRGVVTRNTIKTNIADGEPIYMDFQASKTAHATVLCGYAENDTNFVLWLMDPFEGAYRTISVPTSSSTYTLNVGSTTYTWAHSLVIS